LVAVVGHVYSVFLGGRGGRGVATALGALAALSPGAVLPAAAVAGAAIATTRYVSLGSVLGTLVGGVALALQAAAGRAPHTWLMFAVAAPALILYAHRGNLARLRAGTERRLGERA
jgi:glycerol-3-phosphate acyltransferase PlsY